VRVNAVAPGQVRTDMLDRMLARVAPDQAAQLEAMHPLGFGEPEDVAAAVAFLGGPEARWTTGQVLVVDGGLTA
jgi:NAD(P)-dependent dehydrogenase (short-subunit alcohol dehydrogenase family)